MADVVARVVCKLYSDEPILVRCLPTPSCFPTFRVEFSNGHCAVTNEEREPTGSGSAPADA